MSLQDTVTKQYVSDPKVFADAFNYLIYDGEQVLCVSSAAKEYRA